MDILPKKPKPGRDSAKDVYNFIIGIFTGSYGCNFGLALAKADNYFSSKIFTVMAFLEKNSKNMKRYQARIERVGTKRWDRFKALFVEIVGDVEEFGKDLVRCISEYRIWNKKTVETCHKIIKHDSSFGQSSVLLATVTVGGHFGVMLDLVRCMVAFHYKLHYRIGLLIVPEDRQSTRIYRGVIWFLRRFRLFHAVIVWNNKKANSLRSVEVQDFLVALGLVTQLHRDARKQPDISNFDFISAICNTENDKTRFYGVSALATESPEIPYRWFFITRKEKHRSNTILAITNAVEAVLSDQRTDMTGLAWKEGSTTHVSITGNLDWDDEVVPAIEDWSGDEMVNFRFLPSQLRDSEKFAKLIVVGFREIVPPDFEDGKISHFRKFWLEYLKKLGTTEEQFRDDYDCGDDEAATPMGVKR